MSSRKVVRKHVTQKMLPNVIPRSRPENATPKKAIAEILPESGPPQKVIAEVPPESGPPKKVVAEVLPESGPLGCPGPNSYLAGPSAGREAKSHRKVIEKSSKSHVKVITKSSKSRQKSSKVILSERRAAAGVPCPGGPNGVRDGITPSLSDQRG